MMPCRALRCPARCTAFTNSSRLWRSARAGRTPTTQRSEPGPPLRSQLYYLCLETHPAGKSVFRVLPDYADGMYVLEKCLLHRYVSDGWHKKMEVMGVK